MKFMRLAVVAASTLIVVGACSSGGGGGGGSGDITVGVELPMSGGEAPNGEPTRNGVLLAVKDINAAGGINGKQVKTNVQDDAVNGKNNPEQGAKNMKTLVADASVIGVVGPYNSAVAKVQIPITNEAGLLQCSPANTNFGLTIPEYGAKDLRKANPDKITYVRVAATDLAQGAAGASIVFNDLGIKNLLIVDDQTVFGKGVADVVEASFKKLGGTVTDRVGADKTTTDFKAILTAAKAKNPGAVYYGGVTTSGGGLLRKQMADIGMGDLPYVGPDGINDGSAATKGSFLNIAGASGANTFSTVAAIHDIPDPEGFSRKYKAEFNKDPGSYSAAAYACTQIILKAAAEAYKATPNIDLKGLRAAVRDYVTNPANSYDTPLGTVKFDANGDTNQKIISTYKFDKSAAGGAGDWVFSKQQDFGGQ